MAAPFVSTNRLGNVLEMISLCKQTGILRATRGSEPNREFGQVRFVGGEIQSAVVGSLTAETAIMMLSNWGDCLYSFEESIENSGVWQQRRATGSLGSGLPSGADSLPRYAQSWPVEGDAAYTFASSQASANLATTEPPDLSNTLSGSNTWASGAIAAVPSGVLTIVPRRTALGDQVDRLPLDRRERMVLMLVDGNRTISDLGRLTRLQDQDAYAVLLHLSHLGCVEVEGRPAY